MKVLSGTLLGGYSIDYFIIFPLSFSFIIFVTSRPNFLNNWNSLKRGYTFIRNFNVKVRDNFLHSSFFVATALILRLKIIIDFFHFSGRRANCILYGILYGLACITKVRTMKRTLICQY